MRTVQYIRTWSKILAMPSPRRNISLDPSIEREPGTRNRMIAIAIEAIERGGEASVRVREISDATGVSFASMYHFFGVREGLIEAALIEMYIRSIVDLNGDIAAAIATSRTRDEFYDRFYELCNLAFQQSQSRRRFDRITGLAGTVGRPALARHIAAQQRAALNVFVDVLRGPQERGWITPDLDLATYAAWLTSLSLGRVVIEIDAELNLADDSSWNKMTVAALIAIAKGELSLGVPALHPV